MKNLLVKELADRVPQHWTVLVMSDRGLYAPWLYRKIVSLGWHPFMRINKQGNFRPQGEGKFRSLATAQRPTSVVPGVAKWTVSLEKPVASNARCWCAGMRAMRKCG